MKTNLNKKTTILIVDDTPAELLMISSQLQERGYETLTAKNGKDALNILKTNDVDMVMSDYVMPEMNGLELLTKVRKKYEIPFIMITSYGNIDDAVLSVRMGAEDYIVRPCSSNELYLRIGRVLEYWRISEENREYKAHHHSLCNFDNIITRSAEVEKAIFLASKVAKNQTTTVAFFGERGTGKEFFARAIHCASGCPESRFIRINCAGVPSELLEIEIFGEVRDAFNGTDNVGEGKLGLARNGTVFLDEIGYLPSELQAKLLRVITKREYENVGSDKKIPTNARIIVTSSSDLNLLVAQGKFRADLFRRINAYPILLPPLRERQEDIPLLAEYFVNRFRGELGKSVPGISKEAMKLLSKHFWAGNVREFKNCIERAVILSNKDMISPLHLSLVSNYQPVKEQNLSDKEKVRIFLELDPDSFSLDEVIRRTLEIALAQCKNNKKRAARLLKIDRNMFYRRTVSD